ncbi:indole-3-acetaldehyde oxidase-like [Triticum dicoccoides]|uniref:indole-3-acetaldehyde oxidase-like n=1 Tax=Triticum dicoccoides TaxID=85692 RepID=UPI0018901268|nr:indole-3-acetaldehyde oxidase-like [Triticum dicoccoides]
MEMGKETARVVVLAVNGVRREAAGADVHPSMTLLEFLRTKTPVRGPKISCGEGGCGACVVLISKYDPATDEVTEFSANSCLTLLGTLSHCSVTTSEGIGNTRDGYHPVQQRLSGFHASQCGFCTPGMCMSIFSALVKADKPGHAAPAPPAGFSRLTCSEAEHAVSGNLCRCTGYRPIVDACKSFAADVDLEDLGLNSFWKKAADDRADVGKLPQYSAGSVCTFPEFLKAEIKSNIGKLPEHSAGSVSDDGWYYPRSIQELDNLFDANWFDETAVKIVASNTGAGVYKEQDLYEKYVDIKGIPELLVIDKPSLAAQKVITVISAKDIPVGGKNIGTSYPMLGDEALFGDPVSEFAGQTVGIVIAETQKYAYMAAKQAVIEYSTENLEPPILTIEDAIKHNSYFHTPPYLAPQPVGDFDKGMSEADHKILSGEVKLESQYYFYMETNTALAIPDEDNCITVYSSTQTPEITQNVIADLLGVPYHNVRVITRRVGGGFGGKAQKGCPVACACALAAFKLRRPVRMYLDLKTDMIMAGGRHPMKVKYSVGFKSDGTLTALHVDLGINAGISPDVSPMLPGFIFSSLKKYNWGALAFDVKLCKTNVSSRSAMRGPGEVQGSFIAEAIIEHVASVLAADTNAVRRKNLHSFDSLTAFYGKAAGDAATYSLVDLFDKLTTSPEYRSRAAEVERFNGGSKWKKRGISCVPITFQVTLRPSPGKVSILNDGSIVVEVGGVEIGQGLYTKVKQMTAFGLAELDADGVLLDKVRVIQADSLSMVQGGFTGGSTTSEVSCQAVLESCAALVERLKPIKESIEANSGAPAPWSALIAQATMESVNLTADAAYGRGQLHD